jgi:hypothetical protein
LSLQEQIRALEDLAAMDAELKILEEKLTAERSTLGGLKGNLKKLEDKLTLDRGALTTMEKSKNELVHDVRTMMGQIEHSREKMNRARTERETNAAQRELEELRKLVRDREDEVGKLTADGDAARANVEVTEGEAKKVQDELSACEGEISASLAKVEEDKAAREKIREVATKKLPPVLYRRYETIRAKRVTAITSTTDGTCKACNMSLPPQLFHRLRREPLLEQCPSCNRIIYYVPPVAQPQAEK